MLYEYWSLSFSLMIKKGSKRGRILGKEAFRELPCRRHVRKMDLDFKIRDFPRKSGIEYHNDILFEPFSKDAYQFHSLRELNTHWTLPKEYFSTFTTWPLGDFLHCLRPLQVISSLRRIRVTLYLPHRFDGLPGLRESEENIKAVVRSVLEVEGWSSSQMQNYSILLSKD